MEEVKKQHLSFSAINPYVEINIPLPVERESGRGFMTCGEYNRFLEYLYSLYSEVTLVKTCVDLSTDYTCGNRIISNDPMWDLEELFRNITRDYFIYGGFAINVLRNKKGSVAELHYIPFYRIRSNEDNTKFWYSKDWTKSYGRVKSTCYPRFSPDSLDPTSIFYFNNVEKIQTYPIAPWSGAIPAAEMQRRINQFHLNSLANSFQGSYIISFNNGMPDDNQKEEIEEYINEKFSGTENTGRIVVNFAKDKEHSVEINKLEVEDYGEKYNGLKDRSKEEILRAFRLNGRLIGDNSDATGFTDTEFESAFRLFNRTVIRPVQKLLVKKINSIIPVELTIEPFTLGL